MSVTVVEVLPPELISISVDPVTDVVQVDVVTSEIQVVEVPGGNDVSVVTVFIPGPAAAPDVSYVNVVTGSESRPAAGMVIWRGGTVLPAEFDPDHDIWFEEITP